MRISLLCTLLLPMSFTAMGRVPDTGACKPAATGVQLTDSGCFPCRSLPCG